MIEKKPVMKSDYLFMGGVFLDQIYAHYSLGPPHPEIKVRFWSGPLEDSWDEEELFDVMKLLGMLRREEARVSEDFPP